MLEILLALTCFKTPENACLTAGNAYAHHMQLDKIGQRTTEYVKLHYEPLYYSGLVLVTAQQQKINVALYSGVILSIVPDGYSIKLEKGF